MKLDKIILIVNDKNNQAKYLEMNTDDNKNFNRDIKNIKNKQAKITIYNKTRTSRYNIKRLSTRPSK